MFLHVGFNNYVNVNKVTSIVSTHKNIPAPIRRLIWKAEDEGKLINLTSGRKTRSVIITDTGQVVLSAVEGATLNNRLKESKG